MAAEVSYQICTVYMMILINLKRASRSARRPTRVNTRLIGKSEYWCSKCNATKPVTEFYIANGEVRNQCKRCHGQGTVEYKRNNADARRRYADNSRKWRILKEFGISIEEYDRMYEAQGGCCKLCEQPETSHVYNRWAGAVSTEPRRLAIDHDHHTNVIRGLLCSNCNRALGLLRDDCQLLKRAALYLENDGKIPSTGS